MGFFEFLAVVCGLIFTGYCIGKIVDIIKTWINRKSRPMIKKNLIGWQRHSFNIRNRSKRRIKKLEAIIEKGHSNSSTINEKPPKENQSNKSIEIEPEHSKKQTKTGSGKMENMLRNGG